MFRYIELWFGLLTRCLQSHRSLLLENLALRQQLAVLKRKHPRLRMGAVDKMFWVFARRFWGCTSPKFCPALKSTACTLSSVAVSAMTGAHVPLHRIMVWPAYPLLAIASKPAFGKSRPPATAGRAEAQASPTPDGSG